MCRRNQLLGCAVLAFGCGLLVCCWLESELLRIVFGIGLLVAGFCLLQKK